MSWHYFADLSQHHDLLFLPVNVQLGIKDIGEDDKMFIHMTHYNPLKLIQRPSYLIS